MKMRQEQLHLYEFSVGSSHDTQRLAKAFAPVVLLKERDCHIAPVFKLALIGLRFRGKSTFYGALNDELKRGFLARLQNSKTEDGFDCTRKAGLVRNFDLVVTPFETIDPSPLGIDVIEHPQRIYEECENQDYTFDVAVSIERRGENDNFGRYGSYSERVVQFFIPDSLKNTIAFQKFLEKSARFRLPSLPVDGGTNQDHLACYARDHGI